MIEIAFHHPILVHVFCWYLQGLGIDIPSKILLPEIGDSNPLQARTVYRGCFICENSSHIPSCIMSYPH